MVSPGCTDKDEKPPERRPDAPTYPTSSRLNRDDFIFFFLQPLRYHACGCAQIIHLIRLFPRKSFSAKMSVRRGLLVDGPQQIKLFNNRLRTEIKYLTHN